MPADRTASLGHMSTESPSSLPSERSLASIGGDDGTEERTPYERVLYGIHHDQRWLREITLGRRVGFYRFRGELGQGNFSTVRLAYHQLTKDKVAVKVIDKAKLDQKTQRMLAREIANMDIVAHPNIIRLFEVVETLSRIHLVLEFAPGGELFNHITIQGKIPEKEAATVFSQILSALDYLHELSIIHRDIKAENVFLSGPGRIKLGDFGFSTRVSSIEQQLTTFCGSPPYAAPELYKDESYTGPEVDIWALGILLYFILTADMPFKANTVAGLKRQILSGIYTIPDYLSRDASTLIGNLLSLSPSERPKAGEISLCSFLKLSQVKPSQLQPLPPHLLSPTERRDEDGEKNGEMERPGEIHEIEREALNQLTKWGITEDNLHSAKHLGARSPTLATYRILSHRLSQTHNPNSDASLHPKPIPSSHFTSPSERMQNPSSANSYTSTHTRTHHQSSPSHNTRNSHTVKSKACVIV